MSLPRTYGPIFAFLLTSLLIANVYFYTTRHFFASVLPIPMSSGGQSSSSTASHHGDHPSSLVEPRLIGAVPLELVPTPENGRRLIFVGDIHGMFVEFEALLEKVGFNPETDHIVATGDMINKGPDSSAVVSRLMSLRASAVRGNHEDHVLNAWMEDKGAGSWLRKKEKKQHHDTAHSLEEDQLEWLARLPTILTTDPLPMYTVHAGLVPGIKLQNQDPWVVMNVRTLIMPPTKDKDKKKKHSRDVSSKKTEEEVQREVDARDKFAFGKELPKDFDAPKIDYSRAKPVDTREGLQWSEAWNTHQKRLFPVQRRTVIYGHDAKRGFQEGSHTFGLDSNCVGGGSLTAMVVEASTEDPFNHKIVQVFCDIA